MKKSIKGFSKLSKRKKLKWIVENFFIDPEGVMKELMSYWLRDEEKQKILDEISENTISNFHLPFGVAPNFLINKKIYCVPMVIEESSVVAAASSSAKYWSTRGGFKTEVISKIKIGQIHFTWDGDVKVLKKNIPIIEKLFMKTSETITFNMRKRGGGIQNIELIEFGDWDPDFYQFRISFDTVDSMGANFINSVLEACANALGQYFENSYELKNSGESFELIMSILSNYTPECLVRASVTCPIEELGEISGLDSSSFANKFYKAVRIANIDPYRATTHNKGIFNGIDAVAIATGNDFRALEACGHAYAARSGSYRSLSNCTVDNDIFHFWLEIPLSLGTIGGLTSLHPMAKRSLEMLGDPSADELMGIVAATGLAQNFAAVRSLITTGIQVGHMRMHLINILNRLDASENEIKESLVYFKDKIVSAASVREFLLFLRRQIQEQKPGIPTS
jgi:hydroxymethylglutaryl-CoA reductase